MSSIPFLTINEQTLSLDQALDHLRTAGKLQTVLVEITQQYLLQQEIQMMGIPQPGSELVEQFILEFRIQQQLTNPGSFQLWLATNGITYADFRRQVGFRLQQEDLKEKITIPKLQEYFEQQQEKLDRFVLSRIVVDSVELAQVLKEKTEQGADFSQLAKEHSIVDDAIVGGVMPPVIRAQMPEPIREATRSAQTGQLIGPIEIEQRYCLLKIEQSLPATLEGSLKREIEEQIFQQWLTEKLQQVSINLNISQSTYNTDELS